MYLRFPGGPIALLIFSSAAIAQTTGTTGGNSPFDNVQPSLAVTQVMVKQGFFPTNAATDPGAAAVGVTWGFIYDFAGGFVPANTFNANGQTLAAGQNTALFSALGGFTYGGDGISNFKLPNLVGTATVGAGTGPGLSPWTIGQTGGSTTTSLTTSQLPAHDHPLPGGGVTGATGGNQPFNNVQPSLAMTPVIATNPATNPNGGPNSEVFVGQVANFAGTFVPGGWMAANGDLLSISTNKALFDVIGNKYGGDGVTTFALPDLRGRVSVGADAGHPLGSVFGTDQTTLSLAQMPAHDHTLPGGGVTLSTGGNAPVSNYQPSLALNYLIALQGIFPPRDDGSGFTEFDATLGQIVAFAGDVNVIPKGWALANGQLLSISQNTALFSLLLFEYGGDGQTTFALPDFRGRTLIGTDYLLYALGDVFGTNSNVLTISNLAAHDHSLALVEPPTDATPIPAALPLFATGLGVLGLMTWRRKRKALAA